MDHYNISVLTVERSRVQQSCVYGNTSLWRPVGAALANDDQQIRCTFCGLKILSLAFNLLGLQSLISAHLVMSDNYMHRPIVYSHRKAAKLIEIDFPNCIGYVRPGNYYPVFNNLCSRAADVWRESCDYTNLVFTSFCLTIAVS